MRRQLAGIMFVWESYLSGLPCINNGTILSSILLFYSNGWVDAMYFCMVSSLSITSGTGHTKADSGKPTGQQICVPEIYWQVFFSGSNSVGGVKKAGLGRRRSTNVLQSQ